MTIFTIEDINRAWIEFNRPRFLVDKNSPINVIKSDEYGCVVEGERGNPPKLLGRTDFISFLISYYDDKEEGETK